jgi:DNA-binding beta-propeller fold protein YncE
VAGLYDGGGDAYQARFRYPRGIAALTDSNGVVTMLIIADTENHMIRKLLPPLTVKWRVSALSNIYGGPGYVDGDAYQSKYNYPRAMVVSPDGSIYVADSANAAIRRLDQFGASTTLALITDQDLPVTPVGITVSQTTWNLYVTSWIPSKLWRVTNSGQFSFVAGSYTAGYADGVGSAAMFNWPWYLGWRSSAGAEELFIADTDNQRIRKVVISTATVSTHAGTGVAGFADGACSTAQFNYPKGVALGVSGELYLVDSGNNRIRKVQ